MENGICFLLILEYGEYQLFWEEAQSTLGRDAIAAYESMGLFYKVI